MSFFQEIPIVLVTQLLYCSMRIYYPTLFRCESFYYFMFTCDSQHIFRLKYDRHKNKSAESTA